MITTPTVFVLGAGASMPYGFPSGKQLKDEMLAGPEPQPSFTNCHPAFEQQFKFGFRTFRNELRHSAQSSVDAFLEHRSDMLNIGKASIAYYLIRCETMDLLFSPNGPWYDRLLERMDTPFEDFDKNLVSFVTFNYDRSLEQFLFTALKHRYGKSDIEVAGKLSTIPVVHVHGQLGYLEWQNDPEKIGKRAYVSDTRWESINTVKNGIKIISETTDRSDELSRAHELLRQAEKVFFLGFGYHDTNMRRLLVPFKNGDTYDYRNKWVGGTCFGLTDAQICMIRDRYGSIQLGSPAYDTLHYLNDTTAFLLE